MLFPFARSFPHPVLKEPRQLLPLAFGLFCSSLIVLGCPPALFLHLPLVVGGPCGQLLGTLSPPLRGLLSTVWRILEVNSSPIGFLLVLSAWMRMFLSPSRGGWRLAS